MVSSSGVGLEHVISFGDVKFFNNDSLVELGLRSYKTDPMAVGAVVVLQAIYTFYCPVRLLSRYVGLRPSVVGPIFFCHFSGRPLIRSQFNGILCKALRALGMDSYRYRFQ